LGYTKERDLNQEELDWFAIEYARYFGHDPSGNWILVVHEDNTSEIFRFADAEEMWCCRPDREKLYRRSSSRFHPALSSSNAGHNAQTHGLD